MTKTLHGRWSELYREKGMDQMDGRAVAMLRELFFEGAVQVLMVPRTDRELEELNLEAEQHLRDKVLTAGGMGRW